MLSISVFRRASSVPGPVSSAFRRGGQNDLRYERAVRAAVVVLKLRGLVLMSLHAWVPVVNALLPRTMSFSHKRQPHTHAKTRTRLHIIHPLHSREFRHIFAHLTLHSLGNFIVFSSTVEWESLPQFLPQLHEIQKYNIENWCSQCPHFKGLFRFVFNLSHHKCASLAGGGLSRSWKRCQVENPYEQMPCYWKHNAFTKYIFFWYKCFQS